MTQTLTWAETASDARFASILFLNNSDDSELGSGVWLATDVDSLGFPLHTPLVDSRLGAFSIQSRWFDQSYEVRFGVTLRDMGNVAINTPYTIIWKTPEGSADVDNATWEFGLETEIYHNCCSVRHHRCWVTRDEWGVGPLQNGSVLRYDTVSHCYRNFFVAWVVNQ